MITTQKQKIEYMIKFMKEDFGQELHNVANQKIDTDSTDWEAGEWFGKLSILTKVVRDLEELLK